MNTPSTHNQPPVEVWRLEAEKWVDLDAAARLLEEGKTTVLEQYKRPFVEDGDSDAAATRKAKLGEPWRDYIKTMVSAKTRANHQRIAMQYAERKYWEHQNRDANMRAEQRMTR